jgi:hypothetical protein
LKESKGLSLIHQGSERVTKHKGHPSFLFFLLPITPGVVTLLAGNCYELYPVLYNILQYRRAVLFAFLFHTPTGTIRLPGARGSSNNNGEKQDEDP